MPLATTPPPVQMNASAIYRRALSTEEVATIPAGFRFVARRVVVHKSHTSRVTWSVTERTTDDTGRFVQLDASGNPTTAIKVAKVIIPPNYFLRLSAAETDAGNLKTVAVVFVSHYSATRGRDEQLPNCGSAYHLVLTPRSEPDRFVFRDLWVSKSDYHICRARVEQRLVVISPTETSVTMDIDKSGYVDRWRTYAVGRLLIFPIGMSIDQTYSQITPLTATPDVRG